MVFDTFWLVKLEIFCDDKMLKICISNPGDPNDSNNRGGAGIGISNTRERLHLLYGEEATLTIGSSDEGGVEAVISLPLNQVTPEAGYSSND